ncbi:MAG: hypothetical protein ACK4GW_15315 [Pseudorhodobacter sp.]
MWTRALVMAASLALVPGIAAAGMTCNLDWRCVVGEAAWRWPTDGRLVGHLLNRKGAF